MDFYSYTMGGIRVYLPPGLSFNSITITVYNRKLITIIAAPGNYNFEDSTLNMDTDYINLVSLDGNRSIVFNAPVSTNYPYVNGSINVSASNVFVKGVNVLTKNFVIGNNVPSQTFENCKGGDYSFGGNQAAQGTFIKCEAGDSTFGGNNGSANGTFIDCIAGQYSFGGEYGANGKFENCTSIYGGSFGLYGFANGTFKNCVSSGNSFASGPGGNCSGLFINCISNGTNSFGANGGTLQGKLYYCVMQYGTFPTVSLGGKTRYCLDGDSVPNNQG
jgi:hypothetical protein